MAAPFMPNEQVVNKMFELEKRISDLESGKVRDEIKEVSLFRAARMMNRGTSKVKELIKSGKLPAGSEKVKTKNGTITRYRIRVKDIREYQEKRITEKKTRDQVPRENLTDTLKQIIDEFSTKKPITKRKKIK